MINDGYTQWMLNNNDLISDYEIMIENVRQEELKNYLDILQKGLDDMLL